MATRVRTAGALWRLLAGVAPPPGATWGQLCELGDLDRLAQRAAVAAPAVGFQVSSWNVRWLLSPHTDRAAAKRAVVARALQRENVAMLQETHWTAAAAAQWGGLFSAARVCHSAARGGPRGGPQGGVAIIVPAPHCVVGQRELGRG